MTFCEQSFENYTVGQSFGSILESKSCRAEEARNLINSYWEGYKEQAEPNFISSFVGNDFQQKWWELCLWNTLLKQGYEPSQPGNSMPDIMFMARGQKIFVECISPNIGDSEDRIPELEKTRTAHRVPGEKIILRITSAVKNKLDQYNKQCLAYPNLRNAKYIIAIDTANLRGSGFDEDYQLAALYPLGNPVVHFGGASSNKYTHEYRPSIMKKSGAGVSTTAFMVGTEYSPISAVLFANASLDKIASFGHPELTLVHNFRTSKSLSRKIFKQDIQYFFTGYTLQRHARKNV